MALPFIRIARACCVSLGVMASAAFASDQTPCNWWNEVPGLFFEQATLADVSRCLEAGADVHARQTSFGRLDDTPLHEAAANSNNPEVIETLLKAGADVHARDSFGDSPLHEAASENDNPAVIEILLEAGADVNALGINEQTPLHAAAGSNDNPAIIEVLLEAGADVNAGRREGIGTTPLHTWALHGDNLGVMKTLVKAGADPNAFESDALGHTPLHTAIISLSSSVVSNRGVDSVNKSAEKISALVAAGADPSIRHHKVYSDGSGGYRESALQFAEELAEELNNPIFLAAISDEAVAPFREQQREAEKAARKQEVDQRVRNAQVSCDKWNTAAFFRHADAEDVTRCVKMEDANTKDDMGRAPMHLAALHGQPPVVVALAKAGADPDALDAKGRTPLHLVAVFGTAPEAVTALVKAGADLDATDTKGRTPLEFAEKFSETPVIVAALRNAKTDASAPPKAGPAVSCGRWNTARFFRNATAEDVARCLETTDPNARNENGRTPMHYAAQGASPALVTALAQAGAELNAPDEKGGWTPLHLAAWFSTTPSVVAALLAAGADPAATDKAGKTPWDYARSNAALEGTAPYWRLGEERSD